MDFLTLQQHYQPVIETKLKDLMLENVDEKTLQESMLYSLEAGGKRIRPLLVLATLDFFNETITDESLTVAAVLEMIHTYSLIHDDLPCMDNDDLRRGKPTNHKVYGEGMAVLAGDALLTDSFYYLSELELPAQTRVELIGLLARAAGSQGMIAGQVADLEGEGKDLSLDAIQAIHVRKTGALIQFAVQAGAILAGKTDQLPILNHYAYHLGLAFQIRDDILDLTANADELGKTPGKDLQEEKSTYPSQLGLKESYRRLNQEIEDGLRDLSYLLAEGESVDKTALDGILMQLRLEETE